MDAIKPVSQAIGSDRTAVDYDELYRFGRRPNSRAPYPFPERQFARLLIVRGRIQTSSSAEDQLAA
jgi:hypothetical protein